MLTKKVSLTRVNNGTETVTENVIKESSLIIFIDGVHRFNIVTFLGKQEKELVTGHLFVHGIIRRAKDISSLTIKNRRADITLKKKLTQPPAIKKVISTLTVSQEDIFNCVQNVLKSPIFAETEAVHCAGIFLNGKEPVCVAEDIGRHHAMDKVIGAALLADIPFSDTLVASTGRMAAEMVIKVCRAGIPIIATKAAVTDRGIALAEKYGVTLTGFVRKAGSKMNTDMSVRTFTNSIMKIYSHTSRIIC